MTGMRKNSIQEIWFILNLYRQGMTTKQIAEECNKTFKHRTRKDGSIQYVITSWKNDPEFAVDRAGSGAVAGVAHPHGLQNQQYTGQNQYQRHHPGATGSLLLPGHSSQSDMGFSPQVSQGLGQAPNPSYPSYLLSDSNRPYQTGAGYSPNGNHGSAPQHAYPGMVGYRAHGQTPGMMGLPLPQYSPQMGRMPQTYESIAQTPVSSSLLPCNQMYQADASQLSTAYASTASHPSSSRQRFPPLQHGSVEDSPMFILHRPSISGKDETIHIRNWVYNKALNITGFAVIFPPASAPPGSQAYKFYNTQFPFSGDMKDWFFGNLDLGGLSNAYKDDTDELLAFESDRSNEFAQPPAPSAHSFANLTGTNWAGSPAEASYPQGSYGPSSQPKRPSPGFHTAPTQYTGGHYTGLRHPSHAPNMNAGPASSYGHVPAPQIYQASQLNHQVPNNNIVIDLRTPSPQPSAAPFVPSPPGTRATYTPQKGDGFNSRTANLQNPNTNYDPRLFSQPDAAPYVTPYVTPPPGTLAKSSPQKTNSNPGNVNNPTPDQKDDPVLSPQHGAARFVGPARSVRTVCAPPKSLNFNTGVLTLPAYDPTYIHPVAPLDHHQSGDNHAMQDGFKSKPSMAPKGKTTRRKKKAEPAPQPLFPEPKWILNEAKTGLINLSQKNASLKYMKTYLASAEIAASNKRKAEEISAAEAKEREEKAKKLKLAANNEDNPSNSASLQPQLVESHIKKRGFDTVCDNAGWNEDISKRRKASFERDVHEEQDKEARRQPREQQLANQASGATSSQGESATSFATPCQGNGSKKRKSDDVESSEAQENHEKRQRIKVEAGDKGLITRWDKEFKRLYPDPFDIAMEQYRRDVAGAAAAKEVEFTENDIPDDVWYRSMMEKYGVSDIDLSDFYFT